MSPQGLYVAIVFLDHVHSGAHVDRQGVDTDTTVEESEGRVGVAQAVGRPLVAIAVMEDAGVLAERIEALLEALYEAMLWSLTRHELDGAANFWSEGHGFKITSLPPDAPDGVLVGDYHLSKAPEQAHRYRLGYPLAQYLLGKAANRDLPVAELSIDYSGWNQSAIQIEKLVGQSGILAVSKLVISGSDAHSQPARQEISRPTGADGAGADDGDSFKFLGFRASHYSCSLVYGATKAMTTVKAQRHPARMNA